MSSNSVIPPEAASARAAHNQINKVRGCVKSQVWLEREAKTSADGQAILHYRGDSDSHIVRG